MFDANADRATVRDEIGHHYQKIDYWHGKIYKNICKKHHEIFKILKKLSLIFKQEFIY